MHLVCTGVPQIPRTVSILYEVKLKKPKQTNNSLSYRIFDILVHKSQIMVNLGLKWKMTDVTDQLLQTNSCTKTALHE